MDQPYPLCNNKAYKILGLLGRYFRNCNSVTSKNLLYISLVRSQLTYGSQVWCPYLLKNIDTLEAVQCQSTKFILNDCASGYKSRLLSLQLLPLMFYELNDILLFVESLKEPLMFIITSQLVPTVQDQHPTISTSLRELTSPRTLISMDSIVCGMLFPLSTSIKFNLELW